MKKTGITLVILCAILITSCYKNKWETLHPNGQGTCDTAGVISYSVTIKPIIATNCASTISCHNSTLGLGSFAYAYDTYSIISADGLNGTLMQGIAAGSGNTTHQPQSKNYLAPCDTLKVRKWILSGCLNN